MYNEAIEFLDSMIRELKWHKDETYKPHKSVQDNINLIEFIKEKFIKQQLQETSNEGL